MGIPPVHLEQHRLPIACPGGLSGTSFCSLMKPNGMSQKIFRQSPENVIGSQCWECFLSLGLFSVINLYQVTCKSKTPRKAFPWPIAIITVWIWLPYVLLGAYPKNISSVFYLPTTGVVQLLICLSYPYFSIF